MLGFTARRAFQLQVLVERGLFMKTFCHQKCSRGGGGGEGEGRIVYSSGHQGTFNPAVITNKEVHMVHGNINTNDENSTYY